MKLLPNLSKTKSEQNISVNCSSLPWLLKGNLDSNGMFSLMSFLRTLGGGNQSYAVSWILRLETKHFSYLKYKIVFIKHFPAFGTILHVSAEKGKNTSLFASKLVSPIASTITRNRSNWMAPFYCQNCYKEQMSSKWREEALVWARFGRSTSPPPFPRCPRVNNHALT